MFVLLLTLLCGCMREDQPLEGSGIVGPDVWVDIPFAGSSYGSVDIDTRSDTGIIAESRVRNIFLFIFDSAGSKRLYAHYFDNRNIGPESDIKNARFDGWWVNNTIDSSDKYGSYESDQSKWTNGGLHIKAPIYEGAKIYAIANIDGDMINVSPEKLNLIKTESELINLSAHLHAQNQTLQRNGYFPMTGRKSPVKIVGNKAKVQFNGGSGYTDDWYLELERMDAKIQFNVQVDIGSTSHPGPETEEQFKTLMSFKPESWQVVHVPKGCTVFEKAVDGNPDAGDEGYFDSIPVPAETVTGEESNTPVYGFTFYMMENRESTHRHSSVSSDYHKRDLRFKDPTTGKYDETTDRRWEHAPEMGTYVIIKGTLNMEVVVSSEAKDQTLCADVTYIVHLGDFGSDVDNYDICRNTYYTYTIRIQGVDKIILEVSSSGGSPSTVREENTGAMGGVNIAKESTYTFDAHYGQRVFSFDADHIDVDHCFWYVKTPYGKEGIPPRVGDADIPSGFDYKWVSFAVNPLETSENQYHVFQYKHNNFPYPGDSNKKATLDDPNPDHVLMDVVQLTLYLRQQKRAFDAGEPNDFRYEYDQEWYDWAWQEPTLANQYSGGGLNSDPAYASWTSEQKEAKAQEYAKRARIYITAYVDEFYYQEHPITHESPVDFWKTFVNQPNRMMFLLCDSKFSLDRESTSTGSVITIRQRSIQTPYNLERSAADLPDAWGTETVDETEGLVWFFHRGEHTYSMGGNHAGFVNDIPNLTSLNLPATYSTNASQDKCGRYNGRRNTASNWQYFNSGGNAWVGNDRWDNHLDFEAMNDANYVFLKDDDINATMRWSCLMRNRDNNGNGIVDPEEIRWYMASSEQIIDLYLGGLGLTDEAMSYNLSIANRTGKYTDDNDPFKGTDRWRLHYISSTISYNSNVKKNLPDMIRAEEGPNIGPGYYHMDVYWDESKKQGRFTTRCMRNLGMDRQQLDPATAASVIVDKNSYPTLMIQASTPDATVNEQSVYTFDCRNMNEKSFRYYSSIELEPSNEFETPARLWKVFETGDIIDLFPISGTNNGAQNYKTIHDIALTGESVCPEGYRTPNIREAAVMLLFTDKNFLGSKYNLVSTWIYCGPGPGKTYYFGGNGNDYASTGLNAELSKPSWGIRGSLGNITLSINSNDFHYVRCVRDIPVD